MLWADYKLDGINDKNTFILDDHPQVKSCQHELAISVPEWNVFDEGKTPIEFINSSVSDSYLRQIKEKLKDYLKEYSLRDGQVPNPAAIIQIS